MFNLMESKPQNWRAVAIFDDRPDQLIFLGRSSTQVRAGYPSAYLDLLDEEEREHVQTIALQRWHGAPDSGRWMHHSNMSIPVPQRVAASA